MKIKYLLLAGTLFVVFSCKKDNNGQLSLTIKTVSSDVVGPGESLQVTFDFSEKGHVIDSIFMRKFRINQDQIATIRDSLGYSVPSYPQSATGQLQLTLDYDFDLTSAINPPPTDSIHFENDTLILKFVAKDQANNLSDTVATGKIIILR
ncbi:MAG TPA: hypothetical protein VMI12_03145 [Puia sp.]|nr:hypothetical protein [Puia sp.]